MQVTQTLNSSTRSGIQNNGIFLIFTLWMGITFTQFAQATSSDWVGDTPKYITITPVGEMTFINGIPTEMFAITSKQSIQKTATFFFDEWNAEGWIANIHKTGDSIIVSATNRIHQKAANLIKTGENSSEGSVSITDMPMRLEKGIGPDYTLAAHLPKPMNTMVLNEVKIRDATGESIMTTMSNSYDIEQNVAYYRERMFEMGWREQKFAKSKIQDGTIIVFTKTNKEANFTIFRQNRQVFITINWLSK